MLVVGLTGGIASGKSTVAQNFKELGAIVLDADQIARKVVEPHTEGWQAVIDEFGESVLLGDDNIDRKKLGAIIFSDTHKRNKLNEILHPRIVKYSEEIIEQYKKKYKVPLLIYEAALLIEVGMQNIFDETWVVYVDREIQISRLISRDKINREKAIERLSSQMSGQERIKYADRIIYNTGDLQEIKAQVNEIWREILNEKKSGFNCP